MRQEIQYSLLDSATTLKNSIVILTRDILQHSFDPEIYKIFLSSASYYWKDIYPTKQSLVDAKRRVIILLENIIINKGYDIDTTLDWARNKGISFHVEGDLPETTGSGFEPRKNLDFRGRALITFLKANLAEHPPSHNKTEEQRVLSGAVFQIWALINYERGSSYKINDMVRSVYNSSDAKKKEILARNQFNITL